LSSPRRRTAPATCCARPGGARREPVRWLSGQRLRVLAGALRLPGRAGSCHASLPIRLRWTPHQPRAP
jgi:hypothetical protein